MRNSNSECCIYTIKYREELEGKIGKPATFSERKSWVTGERLWQQAKAANKAMPVLLGDARNWRRLLCWGVLTNVRVNSNGTSFSVRDIYLTPPDPMGSGLIKVTNGAGSTWTAC